MAAYARTLKRGYLPAKLRSRYQQGCSAPRVSINIDTPSETDYRVYGIDEQLWFLQHTGTELVGSMQLGDPRHVSRVCSLT